MAVAAARAYGLSEGRGAGRPSRLGGLGKGGGPGRNRTDVRGFAVSYLGFLLTL